MSSTNTTLEAAASVSLDNSMGAALIGIIVSAGLWGIICSQTWYYFTNFSGDSVWTKLMVAGLFLLNTAHQAFISNFIYIYLITWYGEGTHLTAVLTSFVVEVPITAVVVFVSQTFMILRISGLSRMNPAVIGVLLFQAIAAFVVLSIYTNEIAHASSLQDVSKLTVLARVHNSICASCDLSISLAIIWYLQGAKTGFSQSNNVLSRLIIFTINTGLLTSIFAICAVITNIVYPNTLIFLFFFLNIGRLHTNVTLATLNIRKSFQGHRQHPSVISGASFLPGGDRRRTLINQKPTIVNITTETETTVDSTFSMDKVSSPSFGTIPSTV